MDHIGFPKHHKVFSPLRSSVVRADDEDEIRSFLEECRQKKTPREAFTPREFDETEISSYSSDIEDDSDSDDSTVNDTTITTQHESSHLEATQSEEEIIVV